MIDSIAVLLSLIVLVVAIRNLLAMEKKPSGKTRQERRT